MCVLIEIRVILFHNITENKIMFGDFTSVENGIKYMKLVSGGIIAFLPILLQGRSEGIYKVTKICKNFATNQDNGGGGG